MQRPPQWPSIFSACAFTASRSEASRQEESGEEGKTQAAREEGLERQCGLAIPDVPRCNEHRLLALLAGDAVHGELGDVVTAVGVYFGELGTAGVAGQKC